MNREQLVRAVSNETGLHLNDVDQVIGSLMDVVVRTVAEGGSVTLTNFGTWTAVDVQERTVRNMQTGERMTAPAHRVMRFRVLPMTVKLIKRKMSTYQGDPITVAKRSKGNTAPVPTVRNVREKF